MKIERYLKDLNDIEHDDWVGRYLPKAWQPYARLCRLDRPVGTWLTLLPCVAALVQAAHGIPELGRLIVFCLGALLMRSLGCTINDIWDRDFDRHVERTRDRPLTSGAITLKQAVIFLFLQLMITASLLIWINSYSRWMAVAVIPLTIIYPLCKRFTYWPQLILGMAFNWGMLMAWTDTQNSLPWTAVAMWLGAVFWQVGYDTMYAYADMKDDIKLGLKSTALLFGSLGIYWLTAFYVAAALLWSWAGWHMGLGWGYGLCMGFIIGFFVWQLKRFNRHQPATNFVLFRINIWTGCLLIVAALWGSYTL